MLLQPAGAASGCSDLSLPASGFLDAGARVFGSVGQGRWRFQFPLQDGAGEGDPDEPIRTVKPLTIGAPDLCEKVHYPLEPPSSPSPPLTLSKARASPSSKPTDALGGSPFCEHVDTLRIL